MQPVGMCDTLHRGVWPFTVEAGSRIVRLARHGVTEELAVATESRRWNACISSALALALALAAMAVWAGPSTPAAALAGPSTPATGMVGPSTPATGMVGPSNPIAAQ